MNNKGTSALEFYLFPFFKQKLIEKFKGLFLANSDPETPWCIAHRDRFLAVTEDDYKAYISNFENSFKRAYFWLVFVIPPLILAYYYYTLQSNTPLFLIFSLMGAWFIYLQAVSAINSAYRMPEDHWVMGAHYKKNVATQIEDILRGRWEFHEPGIIYLGWFFGGLGIVKLMQEKALLDQPFITAIYALLIIGATIVRARMSRRESNIKQAEREKNEAAREKILLSAKKKQNKKLNKKGRRKKENRD